MVTAEIHIGKHLCMITVLEVKENQTKMAGFVSQNGPSLSDVTAIEKTYRMYMICTLVVE